MISFVMFRRRSGNPSGVGTVRQDSIGVVDFDLRVHGRDLMRVSRSPNSHR